MGFLTVYKKENDMSASVKIMRSYDYCHFEVCLGTDEVLSPEQVDSMRKECMRLVDKAVNQYKIAKANIENKSHLKYGFNDLAVDVKKLREKPESEWTPEEKAMAKKYDDLCYFMERDYDYEDDFDPIWND